MGDAAGGVVSAELDTPAVSLPKATDEHPPELDRRGGVPGEELAKLCCGDSLDSQGFEGGRAREARLSIEGGELADQLSWPSNA
jgi:hypothetical protein